MWAIALIVTCSFILNCYSCANIPDNTKDDIPSGVCPVSKNERGVVKTYYECCTGYFHEIPKFNSNASLVCKPKCEDKTKYPITTDDCVNGICTAPDFCVCNEGFELKNGSLFVCHEKCKSGFVHDPKDGNCVPNCDGGCVNGKCIAPNKCECIQGYSVTDLRRPNECHCDLYCAEVDGICECLHKDQRINGLLIHNDTAAICTEEISTNETLSRSCHCLNGINASNGTCVCANGYKMRDGFTDLCEPDCRDECNAGICIEPNQCLCDKECTASALIAEQHKAGINWVTPGILLTLVVLATFLGGGFFIRKRKMNSSEAPPRQEDAISDRFNIEVYSLEDF